MDTLSEPAGCSDWVLIGRPRRRVPNYSQGVIVEPPLRIHRSRLRPLAPNNPKYRIRLDSPMIPVRYHLLQYLDPPNDGAPGTGGDGDNDDNDEGPSSKSMQETTSYTEKPIGRPRMKTWSRE